MKESRKNLISILLIAGLFLLLFIMEQTMSPTHMIFTVLKKGAIYALVAVSMNLLNGFTGLFSLGQAGFMLIGAYTYAILTIPTGSKDVVYRYYDCIVNFSLPEAASSVFGEAAGTMVGVILALICAGIAAGFFAWLVGLPVLRLKSDYLAIATLGFAEIIRAVFQWDGLGPVTNGSNLLKHFPTFSSTLFPFAVSAICICIIVLLINSSFGRAFKAIREDEIAAEAMGINLARHKMMAFVTSSFFAGVGGALLAMFQTTVAASQFKAAMTYEILLIVVIGGIGSVTGSVISSFLFIACSEWWLRFLDESKYNILGLDILRGGFRKVVFSVIIMIMVLFYRRGIMGTREFSLDFFTRRMKRKRAAAGKGGRGNA